MPRTAGALALMLDFGRVTTTAVQGSLRRPGPFRLAVRTAPPTGPRKYAALEHRRRQAQIRARRLLDIETVHPQVPK